MSEMKEKTTLVSPDGGYGWVVVLSMATFNFIIIPVMQSFGMVFKDTFDQLGMSATAGSIIINLNSAFGMLTGFVNGALLKKFGYRKVSFMSAFLVSLGIILTAFSRKFWHYIVAYGLITSIGMGIGMSSYSLAVNTYFKKNKGRAIGLSMTLTGLGPILMPQLMNYLMTIHTIEGVTLILGGLALHSFISASLLHPVKWHMRREIIEMDEEEEAEEDDTFRELGGKKKKEEIIEVAEKENMLKKKARNKYERKMSLAENMLRPRKNSDLGSALSINFEQESAAIYGIDSTLGASMTSLVVPGRKMSLISIPQTPLKTEWWKSASSINLDSSVNIFDERRKMRTMSETPRPPKYLTNLARAGQVYDPVMAVEKKQKSWIKRKLYAIALFLDLDLLKDPIYLNIMFGMSLAVFAELNFSVLTPFILSDFGLVTEQIATFLSIVGITDISFRFLAPYIGEVLKRPPRVMYICSLMMLIVTRFSLIMFDEYKMQLGVAAALGVAKGVRTVYMSLVIPTYVPLEKLASASGIQMMVNGIFILIGGPLLGVVRDVTGSYKMCIVIMNCITLTTVIMWTLEMFIRRFSSKEDDEET